ncbi:tRNA (guanine(37)-N1)-methyltransferase 1 [Vitis vinifera]|uniref:tRNA (Guanine(37)-N1)-methyltransferase 1 n=1 Tax=Vitis vinifera TaxID=29760 RepID=A0A438FDA8_VITVI|nr:tRNA (guanine(37)-N1)-methyltransferase 1 [Vitis vinifera]
MLNNINIEVLYMCGRLFCASTGDVFSGVGPIAISAAKKVKRVYLTWMEGGSSMPCLLVIRLSLSPQVVMNLPNDAAEFLDAFRGIFRKKSRDKQLKLPMIHVYGFSKAQDPEFDFHQRIRIALSEVAVDVEMHRVRLVAPGKWMLRASFILPKSVVFAKAVLYM